MRAPADRRSLHALLLLVYALLVGLYYVTRYNALWTETDTSSLTRAAETVSQSAELLPEARAVYPHGFNYQVSTLFISFMAGVSLQAFQAALWPLLSPLMLALAGFVFYSRVFQKSRLAFLAGLLLFFQSDLLFVILRGSHEKLDWPLMLVALALLSLSIGRPVRKMLLYVLLFYLVVFAMITTNVFFASTFLVSVAVSLLLGLGISLFQRRRWAVDADLSRLLYILLACSVLLFIFMFYIYPPALRNLWELQTIAEKISVLFLGFEAEGQPYAYISTGWISSQVYYALTVFTWILIPGSFVVWLLQAREFLLGRRAFRLQAHLVWLLYAGFAIQVALAIVVDFSGALAQNLQLRIFPGFTIMAAALLAQGIDWLIAVLQQKGRAVRAFAWAVGIFVSFWFAVAPLLKATNEPLLSNKWGFYSPSEASSVEWSEKYIFSSIIWSSLDERLRELYRFKYAASPGNDNYYSDSRQEYDYRYVLYSERERLRAQRVGVAMPAVSDWNRVYDNGDVYFYHRRPLTPFQR
jgi:hypothetical protein